MGLTPSQNHRECNRLSTDLDRRVHVGTHTGSHCERDFANRRTTLGRAPGEARYRLWPAYVVVALLGNSVHRKTVEMASSHLYVNEVQFWIQIITNRFFSYVMFGKT